MLEFLLNLVIEAIGWLWDGVQELVARKWGRRPALLVDLVPAAAISLLLAWVLLRH